MKKKEITPALEALKTVKMHKIEDKDFAKSLVATFLALTAEGRKFEGSLKDLQTAYLDGYNAERNEVAALQNELQAETDKDKQLEIVSKINSHKELFEAIAAYNASAETLADEEVEIPSIDQAKFVEELGKQEYDLGIIAAVFPILK